MFSSRNFGPFLYLQRNSQELVKNQAWNLVRFAKMYWDGFQDLPSKTAQKAWVLYGLTRPFSRYDKTFKRPKRLEQRFLTEVRDDLKLVWNKPLKEQDLSSAEKNSIGKKLELCASHAVELLKQADRFGVLDKLCCLRLRLLLWCFKNDLAQFLGWGKVVLLTLARAPWVSESCKNFYASVGRLITQLKVPIIYAQEGIQVGYRLTWEETWRNQNKLLSSQSFYRFFAVSSILSGVHGCTGTVHYCTVCIFCPDLRSLWFGIFMHLVTRLCLCRSTVVQKKVGNVKLP